MSLLFPIINFVIFLLIMWAILRSPVKVFLATRREQFKRDVEAAAHRRSASEARLQESEAQLGNLEERLDDLAKSMEQMGNDESESIIGAAEERADAMNLEARRQISFELARMYHDVYVRSVEMAFERADYDIRRRMDAAESKNINERALAAIGAALNTTSGGAP